MHASHNDLLIIAILEFKLGSSGKLTPCRDPAPYASSPLLKDQ